MNHSERNFQKLAWDHRRTKRHVKPDQQRQKFVYNHFYFKKLFNSSKKFPLFLYIGIFSYNGDVYKYSAIYLLTRKTVSKAYKIKEVCNFPVFGSSILFNTNYLLDILHKVFRCA